TDYEEFYHETYFLDAANADTDNDSMPDGWEINYGFDPTNADDGTADADGDGLRNFEEIEGYYDANHNGIEDAGEQTVITDPLDADCDNDGLKDRMEIVIFGTDPHDTDTDNDGYTDFEEFNAGTDPLDPTSHPGGGGWFFP
ncbi:unnamed protein product, partial [marine sediment metagenome]